MLRVAAALAVMPFLLVVLLAGAIDLQDGKLGSLMTELFELGMLLPVVLTTLVVLLVFVPLLLLTSKITKISAWNSAAAGFLSALLPVLVVTWPVITDTRLRLGFRVDRLADSYPWFTMGVVGGLLFWLLAIFRNRALDRCSERRP